MEKLDEAGSYIVRGDLYDVAECRGSLWARQQLATRLGCICYVEQHLNAFTDPNVNYSMAVCAKNASTKSIQWAKTYVELVAAHFEIPDMGVVVGSKGSYNVKLVACPSFLAEPGFISNPDFADIVVTGEGIDALGRLLAESVRLRFPEGGLVGLSVGHRYRGKPDPGAPIYDDPDEEEDPEWDDEAEIADAIVQSATDHLIVMRSDAAADAAHA